MPCISEPPSQAEEEFDRLHALCKELCRELKFRLPQREIGRFSEANDAMTARLCAWCQAHDVTTQSLELQIWWRDHQRWDAKRKAEEQAKRTQEQIRQRALAKLTPQERKALGYVRD